MTTKAAVAVALAALTLLAQDKNAPHHQEFDPDALLIAAKRIYVDSFGDDAESRTLRAIVIDSLRTTHRFIVTENRDRADLLMRGSSLETTSQELHVLGSAAIVGGKRAVGDADTQASTETVSDARIAVRLVTPDGDVVWSTTQESKGAKYKGATADAADSAVRQLMWDVQKIEKHSQVQR